MKKIFICHTEYHVLITLIKNMQDTNAQKNDIVLYGTLKEIDKLYKKIKLLELFDNIYLFNYKDTEEIEKIPATRNIFLRRRRLKRRIREAYNLDFLVNKEVYIFNDNSIIGIYLRMQKMNYHIIEDGLDCYKNIERHYNFKGLKYKLRILTNDITCSFGTSKYVQNIEVNSKKDIDVFFKDKFIEVPRSELFSKLEKDEKEKIIEVFLDKPLNLKGEVSILLTQPLYKDEFLSNEKQQMEMYQYIIQNYMEGTIVIKPHPRDEVDYTQMSKEYIILENGFPIEILNFMDNILIRKCITAFSTSIDFINFCESKITLGSEWVKKYKNGEINGKK